MMKSVKPKGLCRPFEGLKTLLEAQSISLKDNADILQPESPQPSTGAETDQALFEAAMADVERITQNICAKQQVEKSDAAELDKPDESETRLHLQALIETGKGFVVADTSEYIEGIGYNVNRQVAKRLHNGHFSIQGHIDLHGLAVASGKRMVLIIHGRGLSSPEKPILKTKVIKWLTSGIWRKWVLAFTSARLCDGGAGATYVLLRKRPATKRLKKRSQTKKLLDKRPKDH